ncbi:PqqD family peptide modification chaperone [Benzoatithermus flavus]|uniref:PqqD family peptide modification chaperone n=1 Tax=Benzoatithermus flavus TaxID=3108223 RepID=A0ABU8XUX6_9PROT
MLDDAGLLLDPTGQELLALSTTATFLWCALMEGMSTGEIVAAYAESFARDEATAAAELGAALLDWAGRGLLAAGAPPARRSPPPAPRRASASSSGPTAPAAARRRYRILGMLFEVGFASEAEADTVDEVLGHFAADGKDVAARAVCAGEAAGTALWIDGRRHDVAPDVAGLAPMVKHALVAEAVNRYGFALCVHGAMLRRGGSALLLPAAPGSGKTCLSLALAAAGFAWHTDETVLLDGERLLARGVPACPCVKQPAWELVAPFAPDLPKRRVYRRADGKLVRYPLPPADPADPALVRAWPVRWLVFPRYVAEAPAGLVRLDRVEALRRLLAETPAMRVALDTDFVRRLVDWIGGIDCYTLAFDAFAPAVAVLDRLAEPRLRSSLAA